MLALHLLLLTGGLPDFMPSAPTRLGEMPAEAHTLTQASRPAGSSQVSTPARISTGIYALGMASCAEGVANRYAQERVQGKRFDQALAEMRATEIELAQAREALADRVVRAPFAGVVGMAAVETGDRVSADTALTTLDDRRSLLVDFQLPELYLARVQAAQAVRATTPAWPDRVFEGRVSEIDSRIDPVTRTARVRATLPNTDDRLRPGMSFQLRVVLAGQTRVSVPELALQFDRDGPYVWAVREGNAQRVAARPLRRTGGRVLIDAELRAGEQVVVEGVQRLREGRPVRVIGNGAAP